MLIWICHIFLKNARDIATHCMYKMFKAFVLTLNSELGHAALQTGHGGPADA